MLPKNFFIGLILLAFIACSTSKINDSKNCETINSLTKKNLILKQSMSIAINDVILHYCDEGKKDAHPVILIHGFGASLHTWNGWAEILKKDFRVIRLDLPGFGLTSRSDPPLEYTEELWLETINQLVSRLKLKNFSLAGNSLGGYISFKYALNYPDKIHKLILIDSVGYPQSLPGLLKLATFPVTGDLAKMMMPRFLVKMCLRDVYGNPDLVTEEIIDRYHYLINLPGARRDFINIVRKMKVQAADPLLGNDIKHIKCPVLILWGVLDNWTKVELADQWARDLPHAVIIKYPNLGHVPQEENAYKTGMDARQFLMKEKAMYSESLKNERTYNE